VAVILATVALLVPAISVSAAPPLAPAGGFVDSILFYEQRSSAQALSDLNSSAMDIYTGVFTNSADLGALRANPNLRPVEAYGRDYDLWVNPVAISNPNQFNPFTLQPVRRALNFLLDRDAINSNFFGRQGLPHAAIWHSWHPETARHPFFFADIERAYGFDPVRARSMIATAMIGAGATFNGTWRWQGNPIVVRLIQRIEDIRFDLARYVATQLESAGFAVELVPMSAGQAFGIVYFGPPDTGSWMVYTEGFQQPWVTAWPDEWLAGFHTFWSGETVWDRHSAPPALQDLATRLLFTQYNSLDERRALIETGVPLAIEDSVRVWLISSGTYAASNRVSTFVHDSANGLASPFTPRTARFATPGGTLRIGQTIQLTQAYQPWRGFAGGQGPDGLIGNTFMDLGILPQPHTGESVSIRAAYSVTTAGPFGTFPVPSDAMTYATSSNTWTTVPSGTTARSKVTFDYTFGNWHHGVPITMADVLAQVALIARRDHGDIASHDRFATSAHDGRFQALFRGLRVLDPHTLEVYLDDGSLIPSVSADIANVWPQVPWEVAELAMATVLRDKTRISLSSAIRSGLLWLDLSRGPSLGLMDQALSDGTVNRAGPGVTRPPGFSGLIGQAEAEARWAALATWRTSRGHYFPSNGPYALRSADVVTRQVLLDRAPSYPFPADRWDALIGPPIVELAIERPDDINPGDAASVTLRTSVGGEPRDDALVQYRIVRASDHVVVAQGVPTFVGGGRWRIDLSSAFTASLSPGRYIVEVAASTPAAPYVVIESRKFTIEVNR
jgi:peptide/nickel transport system substrate-binding protein